jgi:hypothetical protein
LFDEAMDAIAEAIALTAERNEAAHGWLQIADGHFRFFVPQTDSRPTLVRESRDIDWLPTLLNAFVMQQTEATPQWRGSAARQVFLSRSNMPASPNRGGDSSDIGTVGTQTQPWVGMARRIYASDNKPVRGEEDGVTCTRQCEAARNTSVSYLSHSDPSSSWPSLCPNPTRTAYTSVHPQGGKKRARFGPAIELGWFRYIQNIFEPLGRREDFWWPEKTFTLSLKPRWFMTRG